MCIRVCIRMCMCIRTCVCVCICICIWKYIHIPFIPLLERSMYVYVYVYVYEYVYVYVYAYVYVYVSIRICNYIHTQYIYTYTIHLYLYWSVAHSAHVLFQWPCGPVASCHRTGTPRHLALPFLLAAPLLLPLALTSVLPSRPRPSRGAA